MVLTSNYSLEYLTRVIWSAMSSRALRVMSSLSHICVLASNLLENLQVLARDMHESVKFELSCTIIMLIVVIILVH